MDDQIADHEALRRGIREKYRDVAVDPDRTFEFCTGRPASSATSSRSWYDCGSTDVSAPSCHGGTVTAPMGDTAAVPPQARRPAAPQRQALPAPARNPPGRSPAS